MSRQVSSGDFNSLLNAEHAADHVHSLLQTLMGNMEGSAHAAHLQILNFIGCNLHSSSLVKLAEVLRCLPTLLELNLSLNYLSGNGLCSLLSATSTSLQTLILRNSGVTGAGFASAPRHFNLNSLTHLDVSDNSDLMASGFVFMLESCTPKFLNHLRASNCGIDLCSCLDLLPSVLAIFRRAISLHYLDLSYNTIGVAVVESMLRSMSPDPQLFGRPKFTNRSAVDVLPSQHALMPWISPLQHLNLSCTACEDVDESISGHFDKWFDSVLPYFSNLTHLFLSSNNCIFNVRSGITHLSKLVCFDLSDCKNLLNVTDALFADVEGRSCSVRLNGCSDLEYPPPKVAEAGLKAIRQFISSTKKCDTMVLRHVKVIVLGSSADSRCSFVRRLANISGTDEKSFDEMNQLIRERHFSTKPLQHQLSFKVTEKRPSLSFWNFPEDLEIFPHIDFHISSRQTVYCILFNIGDSHEAIAQQISYWLSAIFQSSGTQLEDQSIRVHLIGSDLSSPVTQRVTLWHDVDCDEQSVYILPMSEQRKRGVVDTVQNVLSAMGLLAHFNSQSRIFLDWWTSADPRFPLRMTDAIFTSAADVLDGPEMLQFPILYEHIMEELKLLARRCQDTKSLPLIRLCDIPLHLHQEFKVLSGSHRNPRKLEAIKLCSDAGALIYFRDHRERDWICVNMNFGVDVTASFINFTTNLKTSSSSYNCSILSKDSLFKIFNSVFQSAGRLTVSWYASSLTPSSAVALFAFFEAQKLLLPVPSPDCDSNSEDSFGYLVPTLLNERPNDWRSVFSHLYSGRFVHGSATASWGFGVPIRVRGLRFMSSNIDFCITVSQFLQITLRKCREHRHMWDASFLYHVSGASIFVRCKRPSLYSRNTLSRYALQTTAAE